MRTNPKLEAFLPIDPGPGGGGGWASQPMQQQSAKSKPKDDDDDDDDDEDDDDDDDDEDDDDEDADKTDDELRAELKAIRQSLKTANGQSAKRRKRERELRQQLDEARKPKKPKADDEEKGGRLTQADLDAARDEGASTARAESETKAKRVAVRSALGAAGVDKDSLTEVVRMIDLDDLDIDDDGSVDGIDDAISALKGKLPGLFGSGPKRKRRSTAGENDRDGEGERKRSASKSTSERQADKLLKRK